MELTKKLHVRTLLGDAKLSTAMFEACPIAPFLITTLFQPDHTEKYTLHQYSMAPITVVTSCSNVFSAPHLHLCLCRRILLQLVFGVPLGGRFRPSGESYGSKFAHSVCLSSSRPSTSGPCSSRCSLRLHMPVSFCCFWASSFRTFSSNSAFLFLAFWYLASFSINAAHLDRALHRVWLSAKEPTAAPLVSPCCSTYSLRIWSAREGTWRVFTVMCCLLSSPTSCLECSLSSGMFRQPRCGPCANAKERA